MINPTTIHLTAAHDSRLERVSLSDCRNPVRPTYLGPGREGSTPKASRLLGRRIAEWHVSRPPPQFVSQQRVAMKKALC